MADKPPSEQGRGGRGALLLAAFINQPRRPGPSAEPSVEVPAPALGFGALLKDLAQSRGRSIPVAELSEPPKPVGRGRGALLLEALQNQPCRPGPSPELPVEVPAPALGRGALLKVLSQSRGRGIPFADQYELPKAVARGRGLPLGSILSSGGRGVSPKTDTAEHGSTPSPVPVEIITPSPHSPSSLTSKTKELCIGKYSGTSGSELKVEVNFVRLKILGNEGIYEYHVSFNPSVDSQRAKFQLVNQQSVRDIIGNVKTFDGAKLYLPRKLPPTTDVSVNLPTDITAVNVTIKFIKMCQPSDCLQLYNLLFRKVMNILKMTQVGRNYFDPKGSMCVPQHKLEVWPGYVTAVQEYEGGVMLNCDASFRVLRMITARDIIQDVSRQGKNLQENVAKALIGEVVLTRYNNKTYRVDDIAWDMTANSKFATRDGSEMSFVEYYKRTYDLVIQDVTQPLLINKAKKKVMPETEEDKLICLVPEFCFLTGLTDEMRSDFKVMKDIAVHTCITPERRQMAFQKFIDNINRTLEARSYFENWNIQLDTTPMSLDGRLLKSETLILGGGKKIDAGHEADWGRQVTSNRVLVSVNFEKWLIVFTKRDESRTNVFCKMLHRVCPALGINVNEPIHIEIPDDRTETYCEALKKNINPSVQIVVVIFPSARDDRYSAVKKLCCVDMPVPSQVINARTIGDLRKLRSVVQKIALQMNCKLGGELWGINIPIENLMICGLDTYHDTSRSKKSALAFVASMNQNRTRWFSTTAMQKPGQEAGDSLKMLFIASLRKYFEVNHKLPDKIVIFRDGVGDEQVDFIAKYEVEQLTSCYADFNDYCPQLTVVVVQKRINTRVYSIQRERGNQVLANPPSGSIVDHSVTRKNWYDFFLVSQHVRQGTVSPTHYVVVYDSSVLKPEHMQRLTYTMTHLYYNWPGTVRVPAPCQYASKLAKLIGQNIHQEAHSDLSDRLFYL